MRNITFTLLSVSVSVLAVAAQNHPSLEGTWQMDKAHSQYPADAATEVIHQAGDEIEIAFTEKWPGHPTFQCSSI